MQRETVPLAGVSRRAFYLLSLVVVALGTATVVNSFRTGTLIVDQQARYNNTIYLVAGGNPTATGGIQEAINQLGGNPGQVVLSSGTFSVSTTITIAGDFQSVVGAGKGATTIAFAPASALPLFVMSNGASESVENELGGFRAIASVPVGDAIQLDDTSEAYVHDINIQTWNGNGIHIEGRELGVMTRLQVNANNPIVIDANPNSTIELDSWRISDTNLTVLANGGPSLGTGNGITIQGITPTTVIQRQQWSGVYIEGGTNGVDLEDANTSGFAFLDWNISGMYWEQQQGAGYLLKFNRQTSTTSLNNVTLVNIDAGGGGGEPNNGFFFRKTLNLTGINLQFQGASLVALDVDASNINTVILNPFFQTGSTVTNNASQHSIDIAGTPSTLSLHSNTINNVGAPAVGTDAANETYVLSQISSAVNTAISGTTGFLPIFTGAHTIGNSNEQESSGFFTIGGNFAVTIASGAITQIGNLVTNLFQGSITVDESATFNITSGTTQMDGNTIMDGTLAINNSGAVSTGLSVVGTTTIQGSLDINTATNAILQFSNTTGHILYENPPLTNTNISSCGVFTLGGNAVDQLGSVTAGAVTSCTVTFVNTYTTVGSCTCSSSAGDCNITAQSATGFTMGNFTSSAALRWACAGLAGGT